MAIWAVKWRALLCHASSPGYSWLRLRGCSGGYPPQREWTARMRVAFRLLALSLLWVAVRPADAVVCGQHSAPSCAACPQGHGKGWCNGECTWDDATQTCVPWSALAVQGEDLYELLELDEDADEAQIKKAYRKLSVKYHPDKNRKREAGYEVLGPDTICHGKDLVTALEDCRAAHKALSMDARFHPLAIDTAAYPEGCLLLPAINKVHFNKRKGGSSTASAKPVCKVEKNTKLFNSIRDAYEVLSNPDKRVLYDTGGMAAVRQGEEGKLQEGDHMEHEIEVRLQEFYRGARRNLQIRRRVICRRCRKTRDKKKCRGCTPCPPKKYFVERRMGHMIFREEREEPSSEDCRWEDKELEVTIDRGSSPGDQIKFKHMASQTPGQIPGHVLVNLREKKPKKESFWVRLGDDLQHPLRLTVRESLLGFTREFRHFDNHTVTFFTESITKPGQIIRIEGEGMPFKDVPSQFGNLDLIAQVQYPTAFTESDRRELLGVKALQKQVIDKLRPSPVQKSKDEL